MADSKAANGDLAADATEDDELIKKPSAPVEPRHQERRDKVEDSHEEDEEEEDEEEDEDEDNEAATAQTIVDIGRHARMQRIQKVLYDQLVGNEERVSLELRDKEEELRRIHQQREDIGVALYGIQQQLAQLQLALEASHRKLAVSHDERFKDEDDLDDWKESLNQKKLELEKSKSGLYKTQSELDQLNATLKQVEKYNQDLQNEIARTQRAAHKTEETMVQIEKDKSQQDLYIDSLNEQIKHLQETTAMNVAQLKAKQQETALAQETLREASKQMESIGFEKKQLLQQWKSSLIGLQQRDQALQATQLAISNVTEEELALSSEIRGYKLSIDKAQQLHETLTATVDRFDADIRFVTDQLAAFHQENDRLTERYELLQKSLKQTESQLTKVTSETKKLDGDITQISAHLETTQSQRHALEDQIANQQNSQTTANKAANNLAKECQKVQLLIHDKENSIANFRNEIARISVDILNVEAHTSQLDETQSKLVQDLKNQDLTVEKMELEIRQRNDEIEKKMLRLDRLNKKYEQLVSKLEDENTGPLEATIKNLTKETCAIRKSNVDKQKEWLTIQTELVHLSAESQTISETNQELKSKTSVLEQKHLRLVLELSQMQKDIKELKVGIANMHLDTVKLNELIAKHTNRTSELSHLQNAMEIEFRKELKELESESLQMESQAASLQQDKQQLLSEIIEMERQIMLWEKKIQLEKETQAALDPEVGQAEAKSMEKEIHRMKLRLAALQKSQEEMLNDMEVAITKRDIIAMRGRSQKDTESTLAGVTSKLVTLENTRKKTDKEIGKLDKLLKSKSIGCEDVGFQLEKLQNELKQQEDANGNLQKEISCLLYEKQRLLDLEARKQRLLKRLESQSSATNNNNNNNNNNPDEEEARAKEEAAKSQNNVLKIKDIITRIVTENPHLEEVLGRVLLLAEEPSLT